MNDDGLRALPPEELRRLLEEHEAKRTKRIKAEQLARRERDAPSKVKCRVCGAVIVKRLRHPKRPPFDWNTPIGCRVEHDDDPGPEPYIEGYHCAGCGLEYHCLPK